MSKIAVAISSRMHTLSRKELEKLVLKAASKDKHFHEYLLVNYFDKDYGEQDLFEQAKEDMEVLFKKTTKAMRRKLNWPIC